MSDTLKPETEKPAQRKRHSPKERRRMIMPVALDLFARRGFSSVTVRDIASACDINVALIAYHFGSKEGLYRASIAHALNEAYAEYAELRSRASDPIELIDGWFNINMQFYGSLLKLLKVTVDHAFSSAPSDEINQLIRDLYTHETDLLEDCIAAGIEQGLFTPTDSAQLALFVSVHLDGIFLASMIRPNCNIADLVDNLRQNLWHQLGHDAPDGPVTILASQKP